MCTADFSLPEVSMTGCGATKVQPSVVLYSLQNQTVSAFSFFDLDLSGLTMAKSGGLSIIYDSYSPKGESYSNS